MLGLDVGELAQARRRVRPARPGRGDRRLDVLPDVAPFDAGGPGEGEPPPEEPAGNAHQPADGAERPLEVGVGDRKSVV